MDCVSRGYLFSTFGPAVDLCSREEAYLTGGGVRSVLLCGYRYLEIVINYIGLGKWWPAIF